MDGVWDILRNIWYTDNSRYTDDSLGQLFEDKHTVSSPKLSISVNTSRQFLMGVCTEEDATVELYVSGCLIHTCNTYADIRQPILWNKYPIPLFSLNRQSIYLRTTASSLTVFTCYIPTDIINSSRKYPLYAPKNPLYYYGIHSGYDGYWDIHSIREYPLEPNSIMLPNIYEPLAALYAKLGRAWVSGNMYEEVLPVINGMVTITERKGILMGICIPTDANVDILSDTDVICGYSTIASNANSKYRILNNIGFLPLDAVKHNTLRIKIQGDSECVKLYYCATTAVEAEYLQQTPLYFKTIGIYNDRRNEGIICCEGYAMAGNQQDAMFLKCRQTFPSFDEEKLRFQHIRERMNLIKNELFQVIARRSIS
jgi:hypothetical protein